MDFSDNNMHLIYFKHCSNIEKQEIRKNENAI